MARSKPVGYEELIQRFELNVIPNWHRSSVSDGSRRVVQSGDSVIEEFPFAYWPGDTVGDHLEFALKYDGVNLGILAAIFDVIDPLDIVTYVQSKPTGQYSRRIWFLYEFLTEKLLPLDNVTQGNYVDLLERRKYYVTEPGDRVRRQRIRNNLLGDSRFCPIVRRTKRLSKFESMDLSTRGREVVSQYSAEMLHRALDYLYTKETRSSYEIERIRPDSSRTQRFVALLRLAEKEDFCEKDRLIELQGRTVDPRFAESDYRTTQNYVAESIPWASPRVHYVCPKPEDLDFLMDGMFATHRRIESSKINAVIHAAIIAYGFVFLHPFEDGNGRIHRFLIHNILARCGFSPPGIMFPVSAAMLNHLAQYDASLESFSRPLLSILEYNLDDNGRMNVIGETRDHYRFLDFTNQAEALFEFVQVTIEKELIEELKFLSNYDTAKRAVQQIVDLPDRQIDLFIRICLQNDGHLSARKKESHFVLLTDDEIAQMEEAVRRVYLSEE
ncbi:Fic family protein [bacterium]|nr:Fic family protein [bacterium]